MQYCHEFIIKHAKTQSDVNAYYNQGCDIVHPERCLGILARGTDYTILHPPGEKRQPTIEELFVKIEEFETEFGKHDIFLVTEDENIYVAFQKQFGKRLRSVPFDQRINNYDGKNYLSRSKLIQDPIKGGCVYIAKLLILSECKYFIGGMTSGTRYACIMNNQKFEYSYIFDLGVYQ